MHPCPCLDQLSSCRRQHGAIYPWHAGDLPTRSHAADPTSPFPPPSQGRVTSHLPPSRDPAAPAHDVQASSAATHRLGTAPKAGAAELIADAFPIQLAAQRAIHGCSEGQHPRAQSIRREHTTVCGLAGRRGRTETLGHGHLSIRQQALDPAGEQRVRHGPRRHAS